MLNTQYFATDSRLKEDLPILVHLGYRSKENPYLFFRDRITVECNSNRQFTKINK